LVGDPDRFDVATGKTRGLAERLRHHLLRRALPVVLDNTPESPGHRSSSEGGFAPLPTLLSGLRPLRRCLPPRIAPAKPALGRRLFCRRGVASDARRFLACALGAPVLCS